MQRVFLVAVMGIFAGNADVRGMIAPQPVLDFNDIVIQPTLNYFRQRVYIRAQHFALGRPDVDCIYFNIGAQFVANPLVIPHVPLVPIVGVQPPPPGYNIYFPRDGHQPTAHNVAEWSCANVNDLVNGPLITEWYVAMFGGPATFGARNLNHAGGANVNAGFVPVDATLAARLATRAIITMHPSMNTGTRTTDFWTNFRRIAASRIGRILLYRILIEIRRQQDVAGICKACIGADVTGITSPDNLLARTNCRSIIVAWEDSGSSFSKASILIAPGAPPPANSTTLPSGGVTLSSDNVVYPLGIIKFCARNRRLTTICNSLNNKRPISLVERESNIGLFHEMVHWFHVLRHPQRHSEERIAFYNAGGAIGLRDILQRETIGAYFWGNNRLISDNGNANSWKISAYPWVGHSGNNTYVNFEEIIPFFIIKYP